MSTPLEAGAVILFWTSVGEVLYSYLIYPMVLWMFAQRFGRPSKAVSDYKPTVAVVMAVHNEENVIEKKLKNVFSVAYPAHKLSVWIGSDCSTDRTEAIITRYPDERIHMWVSQERYGKAGILNRLIPQINAEILVLTDADIMFEKESINKLVMHFADPRVGGVGGVTKYFSSSENNKNEESAYRHFEVRQKILESRLHSTISAFGPFYAIRKRLFIPFHPHTYSNDDVLMPMNIIRQGYRMYFENAAVSYEELNASFQVEFKRRIRIGAGNFQAFFWLLDFLNPARGWPWFCYVSHKVSRWFSPLFIGLAAVCCGALAFSGGPFLYQLLFAVGALVGAAGILHKVIPLPLARRTFYFMAMNVAIVLGFFRFLAGIRSAVWLPTKRSA